MSYPPDIMAAAERALDALLCNCVESCGGHAGLRAASINDIAVAIAAEREACAKIADECTLRLTSPDSDRSQALYVGGADDASMSIARDIRARSNPSK